MTGAGFLLDLHRCVGCGACVLACRIENGRVETAAWRRVLPLNLRRHPAGPTYFLSVACHHCEEPACLKGCPSGAYEKRPDGIVVHHEDLCLGCRYCEMTCPFATPTYDQATGRRVQVPPVRAPRGRGPAPGVCRSVSDRGAAIRRGRDARRRTLRARRDLVPGFADPAGCRPALRFLAPSGARRAELFRSLEEALKR